MAQAPLSASDDVQTTYSRRTPGSRSLYERALRDLPGGETRTSTFFQPHPLFMTRGEGALLFDQDGNRYLDFLGNYTSLVHGHAHPDITAAITRQLGLGSAHGACTEAQNRLAALIKSRVRSVERIRFANSGTEAVMQAVRTARAWTGRPRIVKMVGGYHGSWDPVMVGMKGPDHNTPGLSPVLADETLLTTFNDPEAAVRLVSEHEDEIAAIIVEPMLGSTGAIPADREFLLTLRNLADETGALLIFDEIQTFRLNPGGAQNVYGIAPDLTTFAKVIGGGLPIGAWGGRADAMDQYDPRRPGFISHPGTFNGNALAMVAGTVALELLSESEIDRINGLGDRLRTGLGEAAADAGDVVSVTGMGSMAQVHFTSGPVTDFASAASADKARAARLHLALINEGVFTSPTCRFAVSTPMSDGEIDEALTGARAAFQALGQPQAA